MVSPILEALSVELWRTPRKRLFWLRLAVLLLFKRNDRTALVYIRLAQYFSRAGNRVLARHMANALRRNFGSMVSVHAEIGPGLRLPHPIGIVIGEGVRIGARCTIYHQVTIGGARIGDWEAGRYPSLGDDVILFAGAKVIGQIEIGSRVTVGANAVVTRDVPAGHNAVGIPAVSRPGGRSATTSPGDAGPAIRAAGA